jgi:ABC-type nitrate/sulfonate/bicarbonate transport system permease component
MKWYRLASYGPAIVLTVALLALWELVVEVHGSLEQVLPSPDRIVQALVLNWSTVVSNTIPTLLETLLGMLVAIVLGLVLAVLLDLADWTRRAIYPLLIVSQTVPVIALAPLFLIWFGFGIGPKVIVVTLYCFFPIAVATADGLAGAEPDLLKLLRSMGASRWQTLWLVRLPGAMPAFFSGLRIAATYSVTGAIAGEFVGAEKGLGIYMITSTNSHALPVVFATIVITVVLSLGLFSLVNMLERLVLPWYHTARAWQAPGRQASALAREISTPEHVGK